MQLFNVQTTNASSVEFTHKDITNIYISGTFNGAILTVEAELPGSDVWIPIEGGILTAEGMVVISAAPLSGRVTISNAGGSTSLSVWIENESTQLLREVKTR